VVSIHTDGNNEYYHANHLGSASVVTDASGNLKQKIEYYPFGTYRYGTSPNEQYATYDYDGSFPNVNYTFTGQEDDDDTGFYNYGARLYDPAIGRFISADSIVPDPSDLQTYNRYSYCSNNPLIYTDPSGHNDISDAWHHFTGGVSDAWHGFVNDGWKVAVAMANPYIGYVGYSTDWDPETMVVTMGIDLASAGVGCGAGRVLAAATPLARVVVSAAVSGAVSGGMRAAYNGGNIGQGMLQGAAYGAAFAALVYGGVQLYGWATTPAPTTPTESLQTDMSSDSSGTVAGDGAAPVAKTKLYGQATCYDLEGNTRADGQMFDPDARAGAMFGKGTFGKDVDIYRLGGNGQAIASAKDVTINDSGPFLRGANGRAMVPLRPDPNSIVDVTPKIYKELTGFARCDQGPGRFSVRVEFTP